MDVGRTIPDISLDIVLVERLSHLQCGMCFDRQSSYRENEENVEIGICFSAMNEASYNTIAL